ncbi:hypothetical protein F383_27361 [Gossypium arboreum]|uniref:Uncharacterized protein n=1 Tax=Gossypium arboreum TaxID=29729 RepID=A0A0B0P8Y7_GOSAR|nr:hypothetical protein F383_27361 [Gossypium arboreum]
MLKSSICFTVSTGMSDLFLRFDP